MARRRRRHNPATKADVIPIRPEERRPALKAEEVIFARQGSSEDTDAWVGMYDEYGCIVPEMDPEACFDVVKRSDALRWAFRCIIANIARNHTFEPTRKELDLDDQAVLADREMLSNFFDQVNEGQNNSQLRALVQMDRLSCGNGYSEIIERKSSVQRLGLETQPDLMYHVSAKNMRITPLDTIPTSVYCYFRRGGEIIPKLIWKYFRRFARKLTSGGVQWFKQYGDPRIVDRGTGEYVVANDGTYLREPELYPRKATAMRWEPDRIGGDAYGTPLWLSSICDVRGRYEAKFVNYDTATNGGTPPWFIAVMGKKNEGIVTMIRDMLRNWRDPCTFNEPGVLFIEGQRLGLGTNAEGKADIKFQSMRDMRSEDYAFGSYLNDTLKSVALLYQLYSIYHTGDFGLLKEAEEREVFAPLRHELDSQTTVDLIQNGFGVFNWKMRTGGMRIGNPDQFYKALGMILRTGGASHNEVKQLINDLFGTNWPEFQGAQYNVMPAAEQTAMVKGGQLTRDENWEPVIVPPQGPASETAAKGDTETDEEKIKKLGLTADALALAAALTALTKDREYEPPDIDEEDMIQ